MHIDITNATNAYMGTSTLPPHISSLMHPTQNLPLKQKKTNYKRPYPITHGGLLAAEETKTDSALISPAYYTRNCFSDELATYEISQDSPTEIT